MTNHMHLIKYYFLLAILFISAAGVWAQPLHSVRNAKEHFANNIQTLDPIEGVYYVENIVEVYSAYAGRETIKQNFVCAILKGSDDFFFVHSIEGDITGLIGDIEKMGDSHNYSFVKVSSDGSPIRIPFQFTDLFSFDIVESKSKRSAASKVTTRFVKKFPTIDMYLNIDDYKDIKPNKSSGTGFFLNTEGYIITNYHVIDNAQTITVSGINDDYKESFKATVEVADKQNDLAILKINDPSFKALDNIPYTFKYTTSSVGEDCFVLGYPLISSMGMDIKLTNGIISSRTGFEGNVAEYQMSAPIQPGNSGGPLFDKSGNVIGVVCAKHGEAENVGYAIKASYIKSLIELLPNNISLPHNNMLEGKTLPEQVTLASKAVCVIIVNGE